MNPIEIVMTYILRNINDFDYSLSKIARRQAKMRRSIRSMSVMVMLYIISTGMVLQMQDGEIKNLKKEIEEIKKTKGD